MAFNKVIHVGQSLKIKTPNVKNFNDIEKNFKISSNNDIIINHSMYPDGFEITMTQLADKIIVTTNMELVENPDGSYSIQE